MGTNYYLRVKDTIFNTENNFFLKNKDKIKEALNLHIGKSSCGWKFLFQSYENIKSFDEWVNIINGEDYEIYDEYDQLVEKDWFVKFVFEQQAKTYNQSHFGQGYDSHYTKDKNGYEFSEGDFC